MDLKQALAGANLVSGPNVAAVAMPLVRLMRDGNLSWADKEEVASVIRAVLNTKRSMDDEALRPWGAAIAGGLGQQVRADVGLAVGR